MKYDFDTRHRAQTLPTLNTGDTVWLPNENTEASVLEKVGPRSYTVATPKGTLQRNRSQITAMPQNDDQPQNNVNVSRIQRKVVQRLTQIKIQILLIQTLL